MLSPKENLLRMYRGELPEYLPRGGFREFKCSAFIDVKKPGCTRDEFGVEYTGKEDVFGGAPIPYPGHYVLDDITKWRDKIKAPDLSHIDWEALAAKDLKDIDRSTTGVVFYWGMIFQRLADFMGFTEGLCAIAEEPEECYALYEYLCDYNCEVLKNVCHYYKPDAVCIPDDTATARAPFISPQAYKDLVKPFHAREAEIVLNSGSHIDMHDCGHCEAFIDDWMDFGVTAWNPAQTSNDLAGKAEMGPEAHHLRGLGLCQHPDLRPVGQRDPAGAPDELRGHPGPQRRLHLFRLRFRQARRQRQDPPGRGERRVRELRQELL